MLDCIKQWEGSVGWDSSLLGPLALLSEAAFHCWQNV